ncbi:MAG: hypothetical protein ACJ764_01820 [Solirubrobacteraceae bacterium]
MAPRTGRPTAFALHQRMGQRTAPTRLLLRSTEDGWSLLGPRGELVFRSMGTAARQRCLEFARAQGVLSVLA